MRKTLVFDLDGTLLNTLEDLKNSTNFALAQYGYPVRTLPQIQAAVGNGLRRLVAGSVPEGTDDAQIDALLAALKAHYLEHCMDFTKPYDGVLPMLEALKRAGYRLAIVSNKADPMVQVLRAHYFDTLIPVACGETDQIRRKPAPDMVHAALKKLGADAADACYIGDSDVDIMTAKNSGLPCLSVTWGFRDRAFLLEHGAETLFDSPSELVDFLTK